MVKLKGSVAIRKHLTDPYFIEFHAGWRLCILPYGRRHSRDTFRIRSSISKQES